MQPTGFPEEAFSTRFTTYVLLMDSFAADTVEGTSRSPIFSWFGSSLAGLPSIRAFGGVQGFTRTAWRLMDRHNVNFAAYYLTNRWISVRLDALSSLVVLAVGSLAVMMRSELALALSSLSLSYTLQMTGFLQMCIRLATETESNLTAVERLKDYEDDLPSEVGDFSLCVCVQCGVFVERDLCESCVFGLWLEPPSLNRELG